MRLKPVAENQLQINEQDLIQPIKPKSSKFKSVGSVHARRSKTKLKTLPVNINNINFKYQEDSEQGLLSLPPSRQQQSGRSEKEVLLGTAKSDRSASKVETVAPDGGVEGSKFENEKNYSIFKMRTKNFA